MSGGVLVVGSVHADFYVGVRGFPRPGETVVGGDFHVFPGGKGANQAVGCSRLGVQTHLVGGVGSDPYSEMLTRMLVEEGVDTSQLVVGSGHVGVAFILLNEETKENVIVVSPGADSAVTAEHVEKAISTLRGRVDVFLAQLELPLEAVCGGVEAAKKSGMTTIVNPSPARRLPPHVLGCVDVITPNRVEAEQLTGVKVEGEGEAEEAARALLEMGVGSVVVTLGAHGALLVGRQGSKLMPAFRVDTVDTVGAGDAFNAGLAASLAHGLDLERAVRVANATAALKVTRLGAQSMPRKHEVAALLREHGHTLEW